MAVDGFGVTMVLTKKHTVFLTRLMAVFILMANSGFSAVLQRCTMQDAECCGESGPALMSCRDAFPHQDGLEVRVSGSCYATSIAGGITTAPAVVQNHDPAHGSVTEVPYVSDMSVSASLLSDQRSSFVSIPPSCNSTTSVEKYVLHAAFLI
jgi:hypothetical protein